MRRIFSYVSIILASLIFNIGLTPAHLKPTEYINTQTTSSTEQRHALVTNPTGVVDELNHVELTPTTDVIWEMLGQVNKDRVLADLHQLTGDAPIFTDNGYHTITNRLTGSEGLQWAKDYVYEELVSLGYSVTLRDWSRSGYADQNIIARKRGRVSPKEEIYFVAHMDGVYPAGAERSPAADDNASGVVDVLELARILSSHTFSSTVVLLFSTGEEEGALGVHSYVDQITPEELSAIKYVVDIDMVGYDANSDGAMELWPGDQPPSLVFAQTSSEIIAFYPKKFVKGIFYEH